MSARGPVPVEVSAVAVLRRKVSVTFAGVTLEEALAEIEGQANVQFAYSRAQVPLGARAAHPGRQPTGDRECGRPGDGCEDGARRGWRTGDSSGGKRGSRHR